MSQMMIIEGVLTSDQGGRPHVAMMGPRVNRELTEWILRPYPTSTTYRLLRQEPRCTFHVIDDALLISHIVCKLPCDVEWEQRDGHWVLRDACRWFALEVVECREGTPAEVSCRLVGQGELRPFWGWNRAAHAVLEGAILCSRLHLLGPDVVWTELNRLQPLVDKTGGDREHLAWQHLCRLVEQWQPSGPPHQPCAGT
ncbi:MAG: hypothetical protein KatS3mg111_4096 [Pirellulaceae bacterium]|nr:MAG: hypothetical protein KatS3mg111_4096 [Pirellulaceae bacterium]